jgi:RNA polymerase sigma-70 factor (ECF subfamily)
MADAEFESPTFLALLRQGDEGAYRRLIRRYHGSLVGVAGSIIGSRAQAEEVVQDAWLAVFGAVSRFEGRSTLAAWIFTIVLNRARSRARQEGRLVALPDGLAGGERGVPEGDFLPDGHWREVPALWDELDPERVVGGRQLWDHVQHVIGQLPAGQRAVIILRDMEGASAEEACSLLALSPENQRVLLHRARNRVRRAIDTLVGGVRDPVPPRATRGTGRTLASVLLSVLGRRVGDDRAGRGGVLPGVRPAWWTSGVHLARLGFFVSGCSRVCYRAQSVPESA